MIRSIFTIAKWELLKSRSTLSPKSIAMSIGLIILLIAASSAASESGIKMDDNIYSVAVTDSMFTPVVHSDNRFNVITVSETDGKNLYDSGKVDLQIVEDTIYYTGTEKSIAALNALESSTKKYREVALFDQTKGDQYNFYDAFPVWVESHYLERTQTFYLGGDENTDEEGGQGAAAITTDTDTGGTVDTSLPETELPTTIETEIGAQNIFVKQSNITTPSQMTPPVPFRSVIVSFLFIFPMYFITQFYSASIMSERVNKRCEPLLTAPLRSGEIVIGKMLPYLTITLITVLGISLYLSTIKTSFYILALLFPVTLFFLAVAFFTAIIARSFKELTFVSVFFATAMSTYLFFPAMFMSVPTISAISPMTFVVMLLEGDPFTLNEYLFSTSVFYFTSIALLFFASFIFKEEDLFTQKSVTSKAMDVVESCISKNHVYASVFGLSIILIPFAFMMELMMLSLMFNIPMPYSIIVFFLGVAFVEEIFKSAGILTLFSRDKIAKNKKNAIILAFMSAFGFFVGEKILILITLAPVLSSPYGHIMFGQLSGVLLQLSYPLLLHTATVLIASMGLLFFGVKRFPYFLAISIIVHSIYNLTVSWGALFG